MEIKNCGNCKHLKACSDIMFRYAGLEKSTDGPACGNYAAIAQLTPGNAVWVIERDEEGAAVDVSGYLFLGYTQDALIVTPFISDLATIEGTVQYHINETILHYDTDLCVFPEKDCFYKYEEAHTVYLRECEDNGNE